MALFFFFSLETFINKFINAGNIFLGDEKIKVSIQSKKKGVSHFFFLFSLFSYQKEKKINKKVKNLDSHWSFNFFFSLFFIYY